MQYEAWVTEATENNEGGANQDKISSIMADLDTAKKELVDLHKERKQEEQKMGKQTLTVLQPVSESRPLTSRDEQDDTCVVFDTDCSGYGFVVCVSPMYPEVRFTVHLTGRLKIICALNEL